VNVTDRHAKVMLKGWV